MCGLESEGEGKRKKDREREDAKSTAATMTPLIAGDINTPTLCFPLPLISPGLPRTKPNQKPKGKGAEETESAQVHVSVERGAFGGNGRTGHRGENCSRQRRAGLSMGSSTGEDTEWLGSQRARGVECGGKQRPGRWDKGTAGGHIVRTWIPQGASGQAPTQHRVSLSLYLCQPQVCLH